MRLSMMNGRCDAMVQHCMEENNRFFMMLMAAYLGRKKNGHIIISINDHVKRVDVVYSGFTLG
jgi:hypothetical protein